jgi:hypothetical protein
VRILTMLSEHSEPAPAMGLAVWSSATQERRLWMVMKGKGASNVGWLYGAGLAAMAVMVTPAWIAVGVEEQVDETNPDLPADVVVESGWRYSTEPAAGMEALLKTPIDVTFEDTHLSDVFRFMLDSYGVNVVLDQRAVLPEPGPGEARGPISTEDGEIVSDGLIPSFKLSDASLGDCLKALARPLGLAYEVYGNVVWVSSRELLDADRALPLPTSNSTENAVLDVLQKPINIEFKDIHLRDALEYIQDTVPINVVLDRRCFPPEGGDPAPTEENALGYVGDGMIENVRLRDVTVGEALYTITRLLRVTYRAEPGFVYIATPDLLESSPFSDSEPVKSGT